MKYYTGIVIAIIAITIFISSCNSNPLNDSNSLQKDFSQSSVEEHSKSEHVWQEENGNEQSTVLSPGTYLLNPETGEVLCSILNYPEQMEVISPYGNMATISNTSKNDIYSDGIYSFVSNKVIYPNLTLSNASYLLSCFGNQTALYKAVMGGNELSTERDDDLVIASTSGELTYTSIFHNTIQFLKMDTEQIQYGGVLDIEYNPEHDKYYTFLFYTIDGVNSLYVVTLDSQLNILEAKPFESYYLFDGMIESEENAEVDSYAEFTRFDSYRTDYIGNNKILISSYTSDNWKYSLNATFQLSLYNIGTHDVEVISPIPTSIREYPLSRLISNNNILINQKDEYFEFYSINETSIDLFKTFSASDLSGSYLFNGDTINLDIEFVKLLDSSIWTYNNEVLLYASCSTPYDVQFFKGVGGLEEVSYTEAIVALNAAGEVRLVMPVSGGMFFKGITENGDLVIEKQ